MRNTFLGYGAALLCFTTSIASASIIIATDPQPDFNLVAGQTGTTVQGELNDPANSLINLTGTEPLVLPSSGQARVEAQVGGVNSLSPAAFLFASALVGLGLLARRKRKMIRPPHGLSSGPSMRKVVGKLARISHCDDHAVVVGLSPSQPQ